MKKIAYDMFKADSVKVIEDSKNYLKVSAVITKEGVYPYPDGMAFKSRHELLKATRTAQNAKVTILDHPDSMVVMSQSQIYGGVEKPYFERDKIRAVLSFDKQLTPPKFLYDVKQGNIRDVSIGFYYAPDFTAGVWNGKRYDYVMRDIVIDHVAAGVVKGRCSFPSCGIGVDAMMRRIALDPFGEYESFADCVSKNQDKADPEAYCATVKRKIEDALGVKRTKSQNIGGKQTMSLEELYYPERSREYNECVAQRITEGMTRGEAEAHCAAATKPSDPPKPTGKIGPDDQSTAGDKRKGDQDEEEAPSPLAKCVKEKMDAGMSKAEAEEACKGAAEDAEPEKTPLERCVEEQMEQGKSAEEAKSWCESELAGEHQAVDSLIERGNSLLKLRKQRDITRRREQRRYPLG